LGFLPTGSAVPYLRRAQAGGGPSPRWRRMGARRRGWWGAAGGRSRIVSTRSPPAESPQIWVGDPASRRWGRGAWREDACSTKGGQPGSARAQRWDLRKLYLSWPDGRQTLGLADLRYWFASRADMGALHRLRSRPAGGALLRPELVAASIGGAAPRFGRTARACEAGSPNVSTNSIQ